MLKAVKEMADPSAKPKLPGQQRCLFSEAGRGKKKISVLLEPYLHDARRGIMSKPQLKKVVVDALRIDGGTQARVALRNDIITEYAESYRNGTDMPRVLAFDDRAHLWLADGFHRRAAAKLAGIAELDCDVRGGSQRDALFYAIGCNDAHGARRTNEDKRKAVKMVLEDSIGKTRTTSWVAEKCRVSDDLVESVRKELARPDHGDAVRRTGRDGRTYKARKPRKDEPPEGKRWEEESKRHDMNGTAAQNKAMQGPLKYDWHEYDNHFKFVGGTPDVISAAYKCDNDEPECLAAKQCLKTLAKIMKGWKRRLLKLEEERA